MSKKRFINKLESKIKYDTCVSFFFLFSRSRYRLTRQMQQDTPYNQTTRATRTRKKKKKEKTAVVRIYTRARARANILIVPFQPYRFALPAPPSRPCPKTRTYVAPVKRSPNSRTGGYFRKCVAAQSNLAKFLGRAIKGLPPFAPYHDVSPAAGVLRIVRPSLARVCSLFACSAKNRSRFLSSTIVARRKQG